MSNNSTTAQSTIAWIGVVVTMLTVASGIWQYNHSKEQEFRKAFWEKQYSIYNDVTDITSKIAVARDLNEVVSERLKFWQLYYGKLSIIENFAVYEAMQEFGKELEKREKFGQHSADLRQLSYNLARACRNSLKSTWEPVKLDDIPENRLWNLK